MQPQHCGSFGNPYFFRDPHLHRPGSHDLCESCGGCPGFPVPDIPYGFCECCKATFQEDYTDPTLQKASVFEYPVHGDIVLQFFSVCSFTETDHQYCLLIDNMLEKDLKFHKEGLDSLGVWGN